MLEPAPEEPELESEPDELEPLDVPLEPEPEVSLPELPLELPPMLLLGAVAPDEEPVLPVVPLDEPLAPEFMSLPPELLGLVLEEGLVLDGLALLPAPLVPPMLLPEEPLVLGLEEVSLAAPLDCAPEVEPEEPEVAAVPACDFACFL